LGTSPASQAGVASHLVFLPDRASPRFFVWGAGAQTSALAPAGMPGKALLVDEQLHSRELDGLAVPLLVALPCLAGMTLPELERLSPSWAVWSLASKLALELVGHERIVPRLLSVNGETQARSAVALSLPGDLERVSALAKAFPLAAHAVPVHDGADAPAPGHKPRRSSRQAAAPRIWTPEPLLRTFLDFSADLLVRASTTRVARARSDPQALRHSWERRLTAALRGPDAAFTPEGFSERALLEEFETWIQPALGAEPGMPRACFRLELPEEEEEPPRETPQAAESFPLRFLLQSARDPSLLVPATEVFRGRGEGLRRLGCKPARAEELLLRALAMSARLFPPIERGLREARPGAVLLTANEAGAFLDEAAPTLAEAGMGILLPAELTRSGQRRLRLRMRVSGGQHAAGTVSGSGGFSLDEILSFRWEVALAGETLSAQELAALARLKAPLVRFRGKWVAVAPAELEEARRMLAEGGGTLAAHEALAAALGGPGRQQGARLHREVVAEGPLAQLVTRLREGRLQTEVSVPPDFTGTLRPYQERGLGWLSQMAQLRLGACLADDMGLGKTIQLLAFLLHRRETAPEDRRPVLLVCPTSVVGNWERELARFAPSLPVVRHHGPERARKAVELEAVPPQAVVLTTYGLMRRDEKLLGAVPWSVAVLDEAQNIKNAVSRTARAARSLKAGFRVALTGTPVENRLAELWSILEYLNPRLLGPLETFRREVAVPIERYGSDEVAQRLKRIVQPFILRRLKSDPAIIQDLPPKQEMTVLCTLSHEQASLYQAAVDESLRKIESAEGIQRRGLVLALITALKQICNHPAQYLREDGPLAGRSGKLQRLQEMLEEVLASGERALIFTQYREMGDRLVSELSRTLGTEVPFLHGGVSRAARDAMVRRFQEEAGAPPIFILSVKAGGTGLNLTAASHVFHFDRWWNPAVEDQATDRAYRIGQRRAVQVHKLLCAGTVEEKVDQMLEKKRGLASRIVGKGEHWITELGDTALRELFSLSPGAVVSTGEQDMAEQEGGRA
jgi:superfamily II DNA or RNA helicase